MRDSIKNPRGFTLIELMMVMAIIAIIVAIVAPSLRGFGISRKADDAASQIVALAQYAHVKAISDAQTYRLNFDVQNRKYWLTVQTGGVFNPPTNDYGDQHTLPDGVKWDVTVTAQYNTNMNVPSNVTQTQMQGPGLTDQPNAQPNTLMQNVRDANLTYVEFQPSGRTDPGKIHLTDSLGKTISIACLSASESFHVLSAQEASQ